MRRWTALGLAFVLNAWLVTAPGHAQRGGRSASPEAGSDLDMLRPYGSRATSADRRTDPRAYTRSRAATPPRAETPDRPPALPRSVHDYYPGMRSGQGPNHNTVNTRTLGVPGRRVMMAR